MRSLVVLLCAVALAVQGAFLSLDSDVTSEAGTGASAERLSIHKMLTATAVGIQLEVESESGHASPRVLAEGVAGTAVTVRQFRRGSKTATVVAVMAPLGSAVSHAAVLGEGGRSLRYIRVGHATVEVTQQADGGIELVVLPDAGRTRPRAATVTQMGDEIVETYNTALVDMHSGRLRPGFAVKLRKRGAGPTTTTSTTTSTTTTATTATTARATRRPRRRSESRGRSSRKGRSSHQRRRGGHDRIRHRHDESETVAASPKGAEEKEPESSSPAPAGDATHHPARAGDEKLNFTDTESLDMDILSEETPRKRLAHVRLDSAPADEVADDAKPATDDAKAAAANGKLAEAAPAKTPPKVHVGVKFRLEEDENSISKAIQAAEKADAKTKKPAATEDPKVASLFSEALSNQEEAEKLASMP